MLFLNFVIFFFLFPFSPNTVLRLRFNHFATECSWDHMYVYDGDSIYAPLIAVFRWVLHFNIFYYMFMWKFSTRWLKFAIIIFLPLSLNFPVWDPFLSLICSAGLGEWEPSRCCWIPGPSSPSLLEKRDHMNKNSSSVFGGLLLLFFKFNFEYFSWTCLTFLWIFFSPLRLETFFISES